MVVIIGAIIVFCLFMGVILIISGCHDYNEANRGMENWHWYFSYPRPNCCYVDISGFWRCVVISCGAEQRKAHRAHDLGVGCSIPFSAINFKKGRL